MEQAGAAVRYHAVDVCHEEAFGKLLESIYEKAGRIDYVIHGAGLIADHAIENKSTDSFRRVLHTKALSAFVLSRKLRPESLKQLVLFSSIAGRFGNAGQADYAAANEILNRLAGWLDRRWPCRVTALNWGPWSGAGMASPAVQERFATRGIGIISPEAGREAFMSELLRGRKGEVEVVLGKVPAEPEALSLPLLGGAELTIAGDGSAECTFELSTDRLLFLNDHRLDGKPVLPAAAAAELMAEMVQKAYPDWNVTSLRGLRVLKGIVLEDEALRIILSARARRESSTAAIEVDAEIRNSKTGRPHYRATVELSTVKPGPEMAPTFGDAGECRVTASQAYRDYLFHGPAMQCIENIDGASERGILGLVRRVSPSECVKDGAGTWLLDPIMLDAGPQLAIIWSRMYLGATALPSAIAAYRRLGDSDGQPVRCHLRLRPDTSETCVRADVYFLRPDGMLAGVMEGLEAAADSALNRLASAQAAGAEVRH